MTFSIKDFFRFPADLFSFNKEILNGKRHFLRIEWIFDTGK